MPSKIHVKILRRFSVYFWPRSLRQFAACWVDGAEESVKTEEYFHPEKILT